MATESVLHGKKVVVIGASSGIGRAVAKLTAAAGATVILASRSPDKLAEVQREIGGGEAIPTDMLDENSVNNLFERVGTLDHLVVTAVADENKLRSPIATMTTAIAQRGMEKFWGAFFTARAASTRMTKEGSITLTSSVSIFKPTHGGGVSVMSAASAAVAALGRALAAELAPVRVNIVTPGVVNSGVWDDTQRAELEDWSRTKLPVRHLGQPDELADAYMFLMTNPYTTGVILPVDGGMLLT